MSRPLLIAIDFDNTFAADPGLFHAFVFLIRTAGHGVILVTGRGEGEMSGVRAVVGDVLPIVFAGSQWKRDAAEQAGYRVDVWVDDMPEWVGPQVGGRPREGKAL